MKTRHEMSLSMLLKSSVTSFNNWMAKLDKHVQYLSSNKPKIFQDIFDGCNSVLKYAHDVHRNDIDYRHMPLLKRAVLHYRREKASDLDSKKKLTVNSSVKQQYADELKEFSYLMQEAWFQKAEILKAPKLTDYFTLEDSIRRLNLKLCDRVFDEKFGILTSYSLFHDDLKYFRSVCELLGRPVSVIFFDIDNFKSFNTEYGETRVDRDVLTPLMRVLYAQTYFRGHVYRHGGDEFIVLLPNTDTKKSVQFMLEIKYKLSEEVYLDIERKPTVSAGIYEAKEDCYFTESEIEDKAVEAKKTAKKQNGKNSLVVINEDGSVEVIKA